jgi:hypothetical protein
MNILLLSSGGRRNNSFGGKNVLEKFWRKYGGRKMKRAQGGMP